MHCIKIDKLEIFANHGVMEEEKTLGQKFEVSVEVSVSNTKIEDNISKTIDYSKLCDDIVEVVTSKKFDLIESLADALALFILREYKSADKVKVEISKPWAPIRKTINDLSAYVERCKRKVALSIGSNIEPRKEYLDFAVKQLKNDIRIFDLIVSDYYNTCPVGEIKQSDFLNAAIVCETSMYPFEMLELIQQIENESGRIRDIRWGPRTLDVDIILYGDICIHEENLSIPHCEMKNREFVLKPLMQIAPYMYNYEEMKTIKEMFKELEHRDILDVSSSYDDKNPIERYEKQKQNMDVCSSRLTDTVLLAMYVINEQFAVSGNKYIYLNFQ